jgi:hypothetical protein
MRLNDVTPTVVRPPETRPDVGALRAANPVQPRGEGVGATPLLPIPATEAPVQIAAPVERRGASRRRTERRTKQVTVTLDTRVGQRRTRRRRSEDEPPASIDVEV